MYIDDVYIPDEVYQDMIKKSGATIMSDEEIEEKKRKIEEEYNRRAEYLNKAYKNPERYLDRKHSGKEKFGKSILKRLNKK